MLEIYAEELQWTYDILVGEMGLKPPGFLPADVYVFEPSEQIGGDACPKVIPEVQGTNRRWSMVLPSRTAVANAESEVAYLRATAVHEATHILTICHPGVGGLQRPSRWFAEATAEWMVLRRLRERHPEHLHSLEYLWDLWDYPELPINPEGGGYSACLMAEYLECRYAAEIGRIWRELTSGRGLDPWRLIKADRAADNVMLDFNVAGYFVNDKRSPLHAPGLFSRLSHRAWHESFPLVGTAGTGPRAHAVADFGCCNFAFHPPPATTSLSLEFYSAPSVRACLAASDSEFRQIGPPIFLANCLTRLDVSDYPGLDHFILIVAPEPERGYPPSTHGHEFSFEFGWV